MPNRLSRCQSLYLRKHAENPIDWWPWCDEALATAYRDDKPIFLSIGYSSCHWCTVMEGEAFSNLEIADYLNANFLPIKVDREERPDLDSIYMQALQMMVGQGGWPLNIFLSPEDQIPFYGGTYFPVEPRYGRPSFLQILQAIRDYYDHRKSDLATVKDQIMQALQAPGQLEMGIGEQLQLKSEQDLLQVGMETAMRVLGHRDHGTRFPMMPYADLALRGSSLRRQAGNGPIAFNHIPDLSDDPIIQRGLDLALGGIYDHVGGGFHRYTVDPTWTVPHFEKMLYDNGQIVEFLANLWAIGLHEPAFERAIAKTVTWLQREMTATEGYFYAAQDADSFINSTADEPEEGAFYVWLYDELAALLTATELSALADQFILSAEGNFEGKIVLQRRQVGALSDVVETTLAKLFRARYGSDLEDPKPFPPARDNQIAKERSWPSRIPPVTDTKMIVAWNSLMISGLARAAAVLDRSDYLEMAGRAAQFILDHQWVGDRLHRLNYEGEAVIPAQSEDYAFLIKALLDLHQAQPASEVARHWLDQAARLQTEFDEQLWSLEQGGYYNASSSSDLIVQERSYADNATPSANGVAFANLIRLALLTEDLSHLDRAERGLQSLLSIMEQAPQACPSLFTALDWYRNHTLVRLADLATEPLHREYLATALLVQTDVPPEYFGLVCQGLSCQEPAQTPAQLRQQIQVSTSRGLGDPSEIKTLG